MLIYFTFTSNYLCTSATTSPPFDSELYGKMNWIAAKRVLKYLKTTADYSILSDGNSKGELLGFADTSLDSDLVLRRSKTGYVSF